MAGLETKVREALIKQEAEELFRFAYKNPILKAIVGELGEAMMESRVYLMASGFGNVEEEKARLRKEYKKEVLPRIQAQFDNPEFLRKKAYENAREQYLSVGQLKAKLIHLFGEMRKDGKISSDVVANFGKVYEDLFEFTKMNDSIVRRLSEVAEKEGLDKAAQKETKYAVIREMFPTADKYRKFVQRRRDAMMDYFRRAQSVLMTDGEAGKFMGEMLGATGKMMEKNQEMVQKIHESYLERTISEIYI